MNAVFFHIDGSFSAPFCQRGIDEVYAWHAKHALQTNQEFTCNNTGCTCNNEACILKKANSAEAQQFLSSAAALVNM